MSEKPACNAESEMRLLPSRTSTDAASYPREIGLEGGKTFEIVRGREQIDVR